MRITVPNTILPWLLVGALMSATSPARGAAPDHRAETARAAAQRAQQHFAEEHWDEAIDALLEAYAYDPDPAYLYARAQAERMRGNCRGAVVLYRRFAESEPTDRQLEDTLINIRRCEEVLRTNDAAARADAAASADAAPPEAHTTPTLTALPPDAREGGLNKTPRPWRNDPLAGVLLATSAVALASGATLWVVGARRRTAAPGSATEGGYEGGATRGRANTAVGIALCGVGLSLATGAAIRYGVLARRQRVGVAIAPGRRGLTAAGVIRF